MDLLSEFRRHLTTLPLPAGRALVAVSGGPDSVALLDLLLRSGDLHHLELVVAHFDHGIHPESPAVAERVRELARNNGLPFESGREVLGPDAGETAAREARHAFLESARVRSSASAVFLAHHADDQAETILMRLLAGSGPAGLAGMSPVNGHLFRPLLPFRRLWLAQYLQGAGLSAWVDPANSELRHQRVWLRTRVLPLLRERMPEVDSALIRVAGQARRNRSAWDSLLETLSELEMAAEDGGISVAAGPLSGYDSTLAESLILAAARRAGCPLGASRVARVLTLLQGGMSGSEVPLSSGWKAELAFGRLRIVPAAPSRSEPDSWGIAGERGEGSWGRWRLRWEREPAPEAQDRAALTAWFVPHPLTVRSWSAGERVRPLAGPGRRLVVRCFQDARVPRSRRRDWPVLDGGGGVVWIPGVCRSDALIPSRGTEALRVDAELT